MTLSNRIQHFAQNRRGLRAAAAERRRLAGELSSYRDDHERLELLDILQRHPDEVAEPVRRLVRQP